MNDSERRQRRKVVTGLRKTAGDLWNLRHEAGLASDRAAISSAYRSFATTIAALSATLSGQSVNVLPPSPHPAQSLLPQGVSAHE